MKPKPCPFRLVVGLVLLMTAGGVCPLAASTLEVDGGVLDLGGGRIDGSGFVLGDAAELRGNGRIDAPATLRGTVSPGTATGSVGVLTFGDTLMFDNAIYICHVSDHDTLSQIIAAGNVTGASTVEVQADSGAIPLWQVIVRGAAGSDYAAFAADPATDWGLDTDGSLDLTLTSLTGDSDTDDMPDYWEMLYFGGRTAGTAGGDVDQDGMINVQEFMAGTDPQDAASLFRVNGLDRQANAVTLRWASVPGKQYRIDGRARWDMGDWSLLTNGVPAATNASFTVWQHTDAPSPYYYRIQLD